MMSMLNNMKVDMFKSQVGYNGSKSHRNEDDDVKDVHSDNEARRKSGLLDFDRKCTMRVSKLKKFKKDDE